jgi:hypothetical protein
MMAERRIGIIHRREPMHKRGRSQRRLARITNKEKGRKVVRKLLRIAHRNLIKQVMRMLPIVQCRAVPSLARLK